jgi:C-terminal processing protease CtpA/Prc
LTPEGHSINKNGITPDIVAVDDKATPEDEAYDRAVKELQF